MVLWLRRCVGSALGSTSLLASRTSLWPSLSCAFERVLGPVVLVKFFSGCSVPLLPQSGLLGHMELLSKVFRTVLWVDCTRMRTVHFGLYKTVKQYSSWQEDLTDSGAVELHCTRNKTAGLFLAGHQ